jgi:hypothetical protein
MTTTVRTPAVPVGSQRVPMTSLRKTALVAGIFYLITFISIPTLALYGPVTKHRDWILSSGGHTAVLVGGLLEIIVALAGIGTAVTLYPVLRRQHEGIALGFVTSRVLEGSMIFAGVVSLLSLVTMRHDAGGTAALLTTSAGHVATYNWTFLLGQSLMPAINAILLGTLLYRSRLVPRFLPTLGLIGAPLLLAADIATLFGTIGQHSTWALLGALPIAVWEFSLGVWLTAKGFRPSPITTGTASGGTPPTDRSTSI